jgi:hypothetical protein
MGVAASGSGFVPIVCTIFCIMMRFFINLKERKENSMGQLKSKNSKKVASHFLSSILTTIWAIGTSVTAAAVLNKI